MNSIFQVSSKQVAALSSNEFAELVNRLLRVEAGRLQMPQDSIDTTLRTTDPDGGVDAMIRNVEEQSHWFPRGTSALQYKSGDDHTPAKLRKEFEKPRVLEALSNGGFYIVVIGADVSGQVLARRRRVLEECCINKGWPAGRVHVFTAEHIAHWATAHPSVQTSLSGLSLGRLISWNEWSSLRISITKYHADAQREQIIDEVHKQILTKQGQSIFRIEGIAGVGKTRIALEILRNKIEEPLISADVLYADSFEAVSGSLYEHISTNPDSSLTLVVDECSREDHERIGTQVHRCHGRLRVITIGIAQEGRYFLTSPGVYRLTTLSTPEMQDFLAGSYLLLTPEVIRFVMKYASGFVKLAVAIVEGIELYPEHATARELATFDRVQDVLKKFVFRSETEEKAASFISIFERLGWEQPFELEARAVASFFGMDWYDFADSIRKLQARGLIATQGRYRYVTPQILATGLADEFWQAHSTHIVDLIGELPTFACRMALIRRVVEVGEASSNQVLSSKLLGVNGIVQDVSELTDVEVKAMFIEIAEGNPSLGLQALDRLLGHLSRDALLQFKQGRREVIFFLEKLACFKEFFADAARLLLALGDAENEHWSNNAGGVWVSLFGTYLGATELPALERHTFIKEALEAESMERGLLAVKAIAQIFTTHEVGAPIHDVLGSRRIPERWRPSIWNEDFDVRISGLELFDVATRHPSEEVKKAAYLMMVDMSRSVISVGFGSLRVASALLDRLETIPVDKYNLRQPLRQEVEHILESDADKLEENIRKRVVGLADDLTGSTYEASVHRWVGRRTFADMRYDEPNLPTPDDEVRQLADRGVGQTEEVIRLLPWLTSSEAENVYCYARRFGELDHDHKLWPYLDNYIREQTGLIFTSAYLQGNVYAGRKGWRDNVLSIWSEKPRYARALLDAIWRSDEPSDHDASLLIKVAEDGSLPPTAIRTLMYGNQLSHFSRLTVSRLLELILADGSDVALQAVMSMLDVRLRSYPTELQYFSSLIWLLLESPAAFGSSGWERQMAAQHLGKRVVSDDPGRIARIVVSSVLAGENAHLESSYSMQLLSEAAQLNPSSVWSALVDRLYPMKSSNFRLYLAVQGWFGRLINDDIMLDWAEAHPDGGSKLVAAICPLNNENLPNLAQQLIIRYGSSSSAANTLASNFMSGSWVGSLSSWAEARAATARQWESNSESSEVKKWCSNVVAACEAEAKQHRLEEEEEQGG